MSSENKRSALRPNKVAFMQGSSRPLWAAFYLAARLLHLVPDFEHPRRLGILCCSCG